MTHTLQVALFLCPEFSFISHHDESNCTIGGNRMPAGVPIFSRSPVLVLADTPIKGPPSSNQPRSGYCLWIISQLFTTVHFPTPQMTQNRFNDSVLQLFEHESIRDLASRPRIRSSASGVFGGQDICSNLDSMVMNLNTATSAVTVDAVFQCQCSLWNDWYDSDYHEWKLTRHPF